MEPLWSPAVATRGNRWQMGRPQERLKQTKTFAVGCDRLPETVHGKEGVDGSSPSEGSAKAPHVGAFAFRFTLQVWQRAVGMEPFMELSCSERCRATRRERDSDDGVQTSIARSTRVPAGVALAVDRLRRCG
jgi:hypothetical protein